MSNIHSSPWTVERKNEVRALWDSHSSLQIACILADRHQIRFTRNQVIGVAHRMGLTSDNKTVKSGPRKPREKKKPAVRQARLSIIPGSNNTWRMYETVQGELPLLSCGPVEPLNLSLFDLTKDTCRWPISGDNNEITFCGHKPKEGKPYCRSHCQLAYLPPKPRQDVVRRAAA